MTLETAAQNLIEYVMERHGLDSIEQLECEHMRALAEALKSKRARTLKPI